MTDETCDRCIRRTVRCGERHVCATVPVKAIRFVAPFAPGGGTDFIARIAAQKLNEAVKQPVIVENRPAAGGTPKQFAAIIKRDIEVWRGVVKRAGVKAE